MHGRYRRTVAKSTNNFNKQHHRICEIIDSSDTLYESEVVMTSNAMRYYHQLWINDKKPMSGEYVTNNRPNRHIGNDTHTTSRNKKPPTTTKRGNRTPPHKNNSTKTKMMSCVSDSSDEQHEQPTTLPTRKRRRQHQGAPDTHNPKPQSRRLYEGTRSMNTQGTRHPEIANDRVHVELHHAITNALMNPVWPWQHNSCFIDSILLCMLGVYTMPGSIVASRITKTEWSTTKSATGFSEKDLLDLLCQTGCHTSSDPKTNTTSQYRKFFWKHFLNHIDTPYGVFGSVFDTITCTQPVVLREPWKHGLRMIPHLSFRMEKFITCTKCHVRRKEIEWRMYIDLHEHWYPCGSESRITEDITSFQEGIDRSIWQPKCVARREGTCGTKDCNGQLLHQTLRVNLPEVMMVQRQVWGRPWTHGIDDIINIGATQYRLAGIIFGDGGHFTSAVMLNGLWFGYNDMRNGARLVHIPGGHTHIQQSHSIDGYMHVWLYDRIDNGSSTEVNLLEYDDNDLEITSTPSYFHMRMNDGVQRVV